MTTARPDYGDLRAVVEMTADGTTEPDDLEFVAAAVLRGRPIVEALNDLAKTRERERG